MQEIPPNSKLYCQKFILKLYVVMVALILSGCASMKQGENNKDIKHRINSNTYINSEGVIVRKLTKHEKKKFIKGMNRQLEKYNVPNESEYETCKEFLALLKNRNLEISSIKEKEVQIKLEFNLWRTFHFPTESCLD